MNWKSVKLGELLKESKVISEKPNPNKRITVKLKVLGVEKRGLENEIEGATKQFIRRAGQFIYGKQNFHKGAFGIIPKELDGFESSADLPSFDISENCLPEWIFYFFKQGNFYLELAKIARGVATQRIHPEQIYDLEIPLPEIEIQKKIISKIKTIENNGADLTLQQNHQLSLLKKLRQQFLQEAIQGKLVKSEKLKTKNEETGQQLLERIKAEKEKLIAEKKIKKEKPLPPIKPEEIPFEIPENWVWCRLGTISTLNGRIGWKGLTAKEYKTSGPLFLSVHSLNYGSYVDYSQAYHISQERYDESPEIMLKENDILICKDGAGIGKLGIVKDLIEPATINSSLLLIRNNELLNVKFIYYYLLSDHFQKIVYSKLMGATIPHLYQRDLIEFIVPIPPLLVQELIVEKLDLLLKICDQLQTEIENGKSITEKLLQQVLREAMNNR